MPTLTEISELARPYAETRAELADKICALEQELMDVRRRRLPEIRRALAKAQTRRDRLVTAIELSPGLFEKPRTQVFHGIRCGFQKARGLLSWDSEESVIRLIRRHFPDQAATLIRTTEKPVRAALQQLPAADLKKLGVQVVDTGDEIVARPMDGELDKLVDRLLQATEALDQPERAEG